MIKRLFAPIFVVLSVSSIAFGQDVVPVRVVPVDRGYQLLRGGKPYQIKGAGGAGSLALLAKSGANSVRTWGAEGLERTLDEAHKLGLTVCVGIWLGHERHGFDYNDAEQLMRQASEVRKVIERFKDHPAVLLWGLGNEMEGPDGNNAAIWMAINQLATMAKEIDPNHPTMTIIAEIGGNKVKNLHRLCPAIDLMGINSYAGGQTLPERYRKAGGVKPFVITEFGPPGMWESPKTTWNVPIELPSTAKAQSYQRTYEASINAQQQCLGSYAFLWGTKQETTATWFGMLLPDSSRLAAADVMTELWSGKPVMNRSPKINSIDLEGANRLKPGEKARVVLKTDDPEGDPIKVRWLLRDEVENYSAGGDKESTPTDFPKAILASDLTHADVTMPEHGGGYRLFVEVRDNHGGAAVANVPLYVDGPKRVILGKKAKLPLVIFDEADNQPRPYAPTGWMGNTKALKLDEASTDQPKSGKICLKLDYDSTSTWGGIVWQDPPEDWGNLPGGWDVSGAKHLTFWARGTQGGEVASFELGLYRNDKPFPDSTNKRLSDVHLSKEWRQFSLELNPNELTRIKSGFAVIVQGQAKPLTIYLDAIQFE